MGTGAGALASKRGTTYNGIRDNPVQTERTSTMRRCVRWGGAAVLVAALAVGCSRTPSGTQLEQDEGQVREKFVALQGALKALLAKPDGADTRALWDLLHTDSQLDADRVAKSVSERYAKADDGTKATMAEKLGMAGDKIATLSGPNYFRSKAFLSGRISEIPGSKLDKITFERDKAWVHYVEDDGDHEKLELAREDRVWKIILPIPRLEGSYQSGAP
jgi:hypothetical protein